MGGTVSDAWVSKLECLEQKKRINDLKALINSLKMSTFILGREYIHT